MKRALKWMFILAFPVSGIIWWAIQYQTIPRNASTEVSLPNATGGVSAPQQTWLSVQNDCSMKCFQQQLQKQPSTSPNRPSTQQIQRVFRNADWNQNNMLSPDEAATISLPSTWSQTAVSWSFIAKKNYSRNEFVAIVQGYERYYGHHVSTEGTIHTKFDEIQKNHNQNRITGEIPGEWLNRTANPLKW